MRILRTLVLLSIPLGLVAQGAAGARRHYDRTVAPRMAPLLGEVLRFPTVAGNEQARRDQQAWLLRTGRALGFTVREAGKVTELELPGPQGAPVIGLVVHGDVQPVDDHWTLPPFSGEVREGVVRGRGAADDKGPLVQALLAMKALKEAGPKRTHTIRLLVGSDEESTNLDFAEYLKDHRAPDFSLVLDSAFPVVVGEKAWNALTVETELKAQDPRALRTVRLQAGLAPSIVPDRAELMLEEPEAAPDPEGARRSGWQRWLDRLRTRALPTGTSATLSLDAVPEPAGLRYRLSLIASGRAAHAGVNAEGGRNALVALAQLAAEDLPPGGTRDLLAFARFAGRDLKGSALGLDRADPVFGFATVVPSLLQPAEGGRARLTVNVRSTPTLSGEALKRHLFAQVAAFNASTGASLEPGGFFGDTPLAFDPKGKLVRRLQAAYARAEGRPEPPAISGGGTYAKRLPNALAFGMWFPGKPYPGHDVDEQVSLADLHRGVHVLLEALADLACGRPLREPLKP